MAAITAAPPRVDSDVGRLVRVIVHAPGPETRKILTALGGDHPMLSADLLADAAGDHHARLTEHLAAAGVEVLAFTDILDDAIERARTAGALGDWLIRCAPALRGRADSLTSGQLIGADDSVVYHRRSSGDFAPLAAPMKWLMFTRDIAVMTPAGMVLGSFANRDRAFEADLAGLCLQWSPLLRDIPVAFDGGAEGVYLQGGDVIVVDPSTLLVGVGNLTEPGVAPLLARQLAMDVVAVRLPGQGLIPGRAYDQWSGFRTLCLHLDSIVGFASERIAVMPPYLLDADHAGGDALSGIIAGLTDQPGVYAAHASRVAASVRDLGWITRYRAGSGAEDHGVRGLKLGDYLRIRGFEIVPIGGPPRSPHDLGHMVERVVRELRYQAANFIALAPGRVVAYEENEYTLSGLVAAGVDVATVPGSALSVWHGGPHCLTLPVSRSPRNVAARDAPDRQ